MTFASVPRPLLFAFLLVALAAAALPIVQRLDGHAVNSVRVAGEFKHVSRHALEQVVADQITKGFFEVDVEAVRSASRALPWVREASVRRVWPDSLHVAIVEREPVARWNDEALMEADGSLFQPHGQAVELNFPKLYGPAQSERAVLAAFARFPRRPWATRRRHRKFAAGGTRWMAAAAGQWHDAGAGRGPGCRDLEAFRTRGRQGDCRASGSNRTSGSSLCGRLCRASETGSGNA